MATLSAVTQQHQKEMTQMARARRRPKVRATGSRRAERNAEPEQAEQPIEQPAPEKKAEAKKEAPPPAKKTAGKP